MLFLNIYPPIFERTHPRQVFSGASSGHCESFAE